MAGKYFTAIVSLAAAGRSGVSDRMSGHCAISSGGRESSCTQALDFGAYT
jgi:hypothetical protein